MKKTCLVIALLFVLLSSGTVYANMAAPKEADIGSSITFEKNDVISVVSEVLDITVDGPKAVIAAAYRMKNTGDEAVSTQTMFLSPNMETGGVQVWVNDKDTTFESQSYALNYDTEIGMDDWKYVVLTDDSKGRTGENQTVDSVMFDLDFAPKEELDVVVSYTYALGGYPEYDFNVKYGRIEYYLTPASMWKDFENLTINLYLDEDMPVISRSNLKFEKTGTGVYQYHSDTLPGENLEILIDENWLQNIFSTWRSPYFRMVLPVIAWVGLMVLAGVVYLIRRQVLKKRLRGK